MLRPGQDKSNGLPVGRSVARANTEPKMWRLFYFKRYLFHFREFPVSVKSHYGFLVLALCRRLYFAVNTAFVSIVLSAYDDTKYKNET